MIVTVAPSRWAGAPFTTMLMLRFGRAEELALVGAGCAAQPDDGVPDDDEKEEYSEPEVRNAPA